MTKDHLYPEEVRAQAIDRRWRKYARPLNEVMVLKISDITDDSECNRIQVRTQSGKLVWLPRSAIDFMPGSVVLPVWLFDKVRPYFQPTA